jgi:hypothetical protein
MRNWRADGRRWGSNHHGCKCRAGLGRLKGTNPFCLALNIDRQKSSMELLFDRSLEELIDSKISKKSDMTKTPPRQSIAEQMTAFCRETKNFKR